MHELALTREIVSIALEHAGGRKVHRVKVSVGELAAVVPDSIRFCFEACTRGTALERAALELEVVAGRDVRVVELGLASSPLAERGGPGG